eukprot:6182825-Pleurochrysis_carterae.AAC.2
MSVQTVLASAWGSGMDASDMSPISPDASMQMTSPDVPHVSTPDRAGICRTSVLKVLKSSSCISGRQPEQKVIERTAGSSKVFDMLPVTDSCGVDAPAGAVSGSGTNVLHPSGVLDSMDFMTKAATATSTLTVGTCSSTGGAIREGSIMVLAMQGGIGCAVSCEECEARQLTCEKV